MHRLLIIALALVWTSDSVLAAFPTPAEFGNAFCRASLDGDMSPIEQALSPTLSVIVVDAWAKSDALQAAAPDEKPPLGDGLPWRSWQDYADGCDVGAIESNAESAKIEIQYSFTSDPSVDYSDRLDLVKASDGWVLDDIEYDTGDTLRSSLASAFADQPIN